MLTQIHILVCSPFYNSLPLIFCLGEKTAQAAFLWPTHPSYLVVIWGAQVNPLLSQLNTQCVKPLLLKSNFSGANIHARLKRHNVCGEYPIDELLLPSCSPWFHDSNRL